MLKTSRTIYNNQASKNNVSDGGDRGRPLRRSMDIWKDKEVVVEEAGDKVDGRRWLAEMKGAAF